MLFRSASEVPEKWGFMILINILNAKFAGPVYPVNPQRKSIVGVPCYASVKDIPGPVELAIITTPAHTVSGLIDECGAKGISYLIVISSDFSETGPEGMVMEQEIAAKAKDFGMRMVGPNTMGIYSAASNLCALMPTMVPKRGSVSMVSQSGNMITQMLHWGANEGVGFDKLVSSGNEADLSCEDYLGYFGQDKTTRVILAYLEGVDPGSRLLSVARAVTREKPVVVFKGGRTSAGSRAASSHTGAMAGSWKIYQAAFRQAGMIPVISSQEFMDCAKAFATLPVPRGNRVAILTRGGGWGVITADASEEQGLIVPRLPEDLIEKLNKILPRYWSHGNPVDLVATLKLDAFVDCLELLVECEEVDAIIALGAWTGSLTGVAELGDSIREGEKKTLISIRLLMEETGKPIISVPIGMYNLQKMGMEAEDIPPGFSSPERAARALRLMYDYRRFIDSTY